MAYQANINWKEGKHFEGSAMGHTLQIDAPVPTGTNQGMNPMALLLVALGGCTGMDVINILQKERKQVSSLSIEVNGERAADYPTVFTDIQLTFKIRGHQLTREVVEHAVRLSEEKYCSIGVMLSKTARMTSVIEIEEDETV
jgi:putative redox protein